MPTILADHNVEGHLNVLVSIWTSLEWLELWQAMGFSVENFAGLGLPSNISDAELWALCQQRGMILITGNRNAEGDDSLELAMRRMSQLDSLPVLTVADPDRLIRDRHYAEQVAVNVLEILMDLERYRGTRRVFVP